MDSIFGLYAIWNRFFWKHNWLFCLNMGVWEFRFWVTYTFHKGNMSKKAKEHIVVLVRFLMGLYGEGNFLQIGDKQYTAVDISQRWSYQWDFKFSGLNLWGIYFSDKEILLNSIIDNTNTNKSLELVWNWHVWVCFNH